MVLCFYFLFSNGGSKSLVMWSVQRDSTDWVIIFDSIDFASFLLYVLKNSNASH